jgi:hypothetical protein
MTNDQLSLVRSLVTDILRRDGPQPGARLKTQLCFAYQAKTGQPFHERLLGFPKFSRLLEAQVDIFVVERPAAGPGDVIVRLREAPNGMTRSSVVGQGALDDAQRGSTWPSRVSTFGTNTSPRSTSAPRQTWLISKPLWSAFINPDPNRDRFLHKPTNEVLTYSRLSTKSVDAMLRQRFEMLRSDCVAIDYIKFDVQIGWMEEFVRAHFTDERRDAALAEVRRLNQWTAQTGFLNLLGFERAEEWRQYRFEKVIARIREWLSTNGLPESVMMAATAPPGMGNQHPQGSARGPKASEAASSESTPTHASSASRPGMRDMLHALIDTLPDDQLDRVLVPGSAVARLSSILRSARG